MIKIVSEELWVVVGIVEPLLEHGGLDMAWVDMLYRDN